MTTPSSYEQLKDDLGYLELGRATECFATVADRAKRESWSHVEYLAAVMAEQVATTTNRRLAARLRYARFPYVRSLEEFDYDFQPSVDRKLVDDLATLRFIEENRPVVFLGQPGCGKTPWPWRLATKAVEAGYREYFSTADAMVRILLEARREGNFATRLRAFTAPTVLVVDDVGLLPIDTEGAGVFFHVVNARYENGHPTLVTTNRGLPAGATCSATRWWPGPSSTGSCTERWCSTSKGPRGGCGSTPPWPRRPRHDSVTLLACGIGVVALVVTVLCGSRIVTACPPARPRPCSRSGSIWRRWIRHLAATARPLRDPAGQAARCLPGGHGMDRLPPPRLHHRRQALWDAPRRLPRSELDEKKFTLAKAIGKDRQFRYEYDFGDDWQHQVVVEEHLPHPRRAHLRGVPGGPRSCPPEDCGGAYGYADMLEAISDPKHEEFDEYTEWLGEDFDPEEFSWPPPTPSCKRSDQPAAAGASTDEPEVHLGAPGAPCPADGCSSVLSVQSPQCIT